MYGQEDLSVKKQSIPAGILLAISLVISIGSQTFLSPCIHDDGAFGPCHWAGRMLLGLGCALGVQAVLALLIRRVRCGAYLSALPLCLLGILTPGTLIDICHMSTMRCRMVMQPAMIILFCAALAVALTGMILNWREQ